MNEKQVSGRYLRILLPTTLVLFVVSGLFNYCVDPYTVFERAPVKGWNDQKESNNQRMHYAFKLRRSAADVLILGNSRASSVDESHPAFGDSIVVKVPLTGTNIWEMEDLFLHAVAVAPIRRMVLTVDFVNFNANLNSPSQTPTYLETGRNDETRFDPLQGRGPLLWSYDALSASVRTVRASRARGPGQKERRRIGATRGQFIQVAETYSRFGGGYTPGPDNAYSYSSECAGCSSFDVLERILRRAHASEFEVRLYMSPSHAWQWVMIDTLGLWKEWETWKSRVVGANERVARDLGRSAFPLWDFSGFNGITTEEVPPRNSDHLRMKRYRDPSHFTTEVGNLVLNRIFEIDDAGSVPVDFGVRLGSQNLDAHLESIRRGLRDWRQSHSEDIEDIQRALE